MPASYGRPGRLAIRGGVLGVAVSLACSPTAPSPADSTAMTPTRVIRLFDGSSLAGFDTWLVDHHEMDPEGVFSVAVVDGAPAIRITGTIWGGLVTKQAFRNYRLVAEFRWGGPTSGVRAARARDSGILLHADGRLGNSSADFNGPWIRSIEFQIIEGGVGDLIIVAGFDENGARVRPSVTVPTRRNARGEDVFDPHGVFRTISSGRVNWSGKSEGWEDRTGYRGEADVETGDLGWTHAEIHARGADLTYFVNGRLVNAATEATSDEGRIMIQSEGAEIHVRRFELHPLD